jgi:hypothetical protein
MGTFQLTHPRSGRATPCASAPVVGVASVKCSGEMLVRTSFVS